MKVSCRLHAQYNYEGFPVAFLFFFGQTMNCVPQPFGLNFLYKKCTVKQLSELFFMIS